MKNMLRNATAVMAVALIFTGSGCASIRPASSVDYVSPDFTPEEVDALSILPVADSRVDKSITADLESSIRLPAEKKLKEMGYKLLPESGEASANTATPQNLTFPAPDWVASIGPKEARWVMVLELEKTDCTRSIWKAAGSSGLSLSCHVFDKKKKSLVLKRQVHCHAFNKSDLFIRCFASDAHFIPFKDAAQCAAACLPTRAQP